MQISSVPDQACLQCHAAPDHNRFSSSENCASCHKEHRGHATLARPTDKHCTACHVDLQSHVPAGQARFQDVPSFAAHPEFALWRDKQATDPGTVEFNHYKHLQLRAEDKPAHGAEAVRKLQEMKCGYCHQLDTAGRYMQPIQFDKHCQECHPLHLPVAADSANQALQTRLQTFLKEPVGHPKANQSAWQVRAAVRERYLQFAQANPSLLALKPAPKDEWLVLPGLPKRGQPATQNQMVWVNEQWKLAETTLFDKTGCVRCHAEISNKQERIDGLPDFGKPAIPQRWLTHSVFDHQAHRMLDCTSCHKKAMASDKRQDVMMPKVASCQSCHQANAKSARADCLECHQFHQRSGVEPWHGKLTIHGLGKQ
jgi:hypothetical protein